MAWRTNSLKATFSDKTSVRRRISQPDFSCTRHTL